MRRLKTFSQGIHLFEEKSPTAGKRIRKVRLPEEVILPLQQHIGAPGQPLVKRGDQVKRGDKIADSKSFVSAPIHASISGVITAIKPAPHPAGGKANAIFIKREKGEEEEAWSVENKPEVNLSHFSAQEIRDRVREAGIVGMGGAAFPTCVKLTPPQGKPIDVVILNGCECEPYLTGDHRLMLERPDDCLFGLKAVIKAVGAQRGYLGIENNKRDAITLFRDKTAGEENIEVVPLKTKYPQGGEKILVKAILKREVPSGGLPLDVGVVVSNVGTAVAISECLKMNKPLIERVVTVSGSAVEKPVNLLVPLGITFAAILRECALSRSKVIRVIMGGPMMGISQATLEVPVIKGTTAILALSNEEVSVSTDNPCIHCGRCVDHCPTGLLPAELARLIRAGQWERLENYHLMDCVECGCCVYVCPAEIPIVQLIKLGKLQLGKKSSQ